MMLLIWVASFVLAVCILALAVIGYLVVSTHFLELETKKILKETGERGALMEGCGHSDPFASEDFTEEDCAGWDKGGGGDEPMDKLQTIICPHCGNRRQKPPDDGRVYPCPHRECAEHKAMEQMGKPLTVIVGITGESSFEMSLGYGGYTDVGFIVGLMLQAGKTLGEELKKHGVSEEVVEAAIRKIEILELQEASQRVDE